MAEYGVHHATFGASKPSVFEVIGHENLIVGLRAAFRHIFKVFAENNPEKFGLLHTYFDEGYTVIDSVFQYIHLRLKGGLFTETFYGLKRQPDPRGSDVSKSKVILWVVITVVVPYLQSQMEAFFKDIYESHSQGTLNYKGVKRKMVLLYLKLYPYINCSWELTILSYYLGYALKKIDHHSPFMHLTSTKLTHLSALDTSDEAWLSFVPKKLHETFSTRIWRMMNIFVSGITLSISVGAFFTQFLNWWYGQEGQINTFAVLPVPPPPTKWPCDVANEICPLCKKNRTNDTVLSSSGFVFCYPCIFQFVQDNHKCPVTGYKATLSQLSRLYYQE